MSKTENFRLGWVPYIGENGSVLIEWPNSKSLNSDGYDGIIVPVELFDEALAKLGTERAKLIGSKQPTR